MIQGQLQQLRERFPVGGINTLSTDEVHELLDYISTLEKALDKIAKTLLAHISTLESELQQVRVERNGLRDTSDCVKCGCKHCGGAIHLSNETWVHSAAGLIKYGHNAEPAQPTLQEQEQFRIEAEHKGAEVVYEPAQPTTVVHVPIEREIAAHWFGDDSDQGRCVNAIHEYVEVLREQSQAAQPIAEPSDDTDELGAAFAQVGHEQATTAKRFRMVPESPPYSSGLGVEEIAPEPYRVEPVGGGCEHCGSGHLWTVVWKDAKGEENEIGQSWGDKQDAEDVCEYMNAAYQFALSQQAGRAVASPGAEEIAKLYAMTYRLSDDSELSLITEKDCASACRDYAACPEARLAEKSWRCFGCDFVTSDPKEAEAHFGDNDEASEFVPICKWWAKSDEAEKRQAYQDLLIELNGARNREAEAISESGAYKSHAEVSVQNWKIAEARAEAVEANAAELQGTFDLMWAADQRAIKQWQKATGKDGVWPDRAALTTWLLERVEAAEAQLAEQDDAAAIRGVNAVMMIRCMDHREVPQLNTKVSGGAECAVCAITKLQQKIDRQSETIQKRQDSWHEMGDKLSVAAMAITQQRAEIGHLEARSKELEQEDSAYRSHAEVSVQNWRIANDRAYSLSLLLREVQETLTRWAAGSYPPSQYDIDEMLTRLSSDTKEEKSEQRS